jgi:hypothetical protein
MTSALRVSAGYGQLDYALSRIHGLLGRVPPESTWATLSPIENITHFVESATKHGLGYWLEGIRADGSVHEIEAALRQRYRDELSRVGHWAPAAFQPLLDWFAVLPYLDFVGYLHRGEPAHSWMQSDPVLAAWGAEGEGAGVLAELMHGLDSGGSGRHRVGQNWLAGVDARLPGEIAALAEERRFNALVRLMVEAHPVHDAGLPAEQRVERTLLREAHRRIMTPPLIPLYGLLVYWLLLRLRSELVIRATALAGR